MRKYESSEMTLGPRTSIAFKSNPIALPRRTCLLAFGPMWLVVRVESLDDEGLAHGFVLGRRKRGTETKVKGPVKASDLIAAGLASLAH